MALATVNGASIAFDEKGHGAPSFVFVHGWAGDRSSWTPQFEELSQNHRCLNIDLRGRGESSATPPFHTTQAVEDVAALMRELAFGPSIIVGHSLGGLVALLLNERHPELVLGTVLGDSPVNQASGNRIQGAAARIREAGSLDPLAGMINGFYGDSTPESIRAHTIGVILSCPPDIAAGMFEEMDPFIGRMDDLLKAADRKPCMMVWRQVPAGDPEYIRGVTVFVRQEPMAGTGHFFQLEQPEVTNALLRAFVDEVRHDPRISVPEAG